MRSLTNLTIRWLLGIGVCATLSPAAAQSDFDRKPIQYSTRATTDRVRAMNMELLSGARSLGWHDTLGWLPSLLNALEVSSSSQTLVFSKTSRQFRRISPARPRAVYFNDETYVGWVVGGDIIEIAVVDPEQGAVFYTIDQRPTDRPTIVRDRGECLSCHATPRTQQVPGFLVRSVYPDRGGQPNLRLGTITTDHTTKFEDRFGGWYVTGTHGAMRHRGNLTVNEDAVKEPVDREAGANMTELPAVVRPNTYLAPGSDIVALMVLEHQAQMHNRVTSASYTTRSALYQQRDMNRILERDPEYRSESTIRRINVAAEKLVTYLLFSGEYPLSAPVVGSPEFIADFMSTAVRDSRGRSLRDLDLKRRLLRYPCSYLIYSPSFRSLPIAVLERVKRRMLEVLSGSDQSEEFRHLSAEDRSAILQILTETHPLFRPKRTF